MLWLNYWFLLKKKRALSGAIDSEVENNDLSILNHGFIYQVYTLIISHVKVVMTERSYLQLSALADYA